MTDPSITDWISAVSSIIATLIVGVAACYAYKQHLQPPVQETEPTSVPVFETAKRLTTLKITSPGHECHLKDHDSKKSGLKWVLRKDQIAKILANTHLCG